MYVLADEPGAYTYSFEKFWPFPVATQYKAWVCGDLLVGTVSSNPARVMELCLM
jgi:hypothetical protein